MKHFPIGWTNLRKKELDLKQKAFAKKFDLHPLTISFYENDERNPNLVFPEN